MLVSTNLSTHLSSVQLLIHFIRLSLNFFIHPALYLSIHQSPMHVFIYAYICLFIHSYIHHLSSIQLQSIHLCSIYVFTFISIYVLSTHLAMHVFTGLSIHYQLVHSCIHLSTHSSFHSLICPSTCLCIIIHPSFQSFFQPVNHAVFFFFSEFG